MALGSQRPALQESRPRRSIGKPLLGREREACFGLFSHGCLFVTKLMYCCSNTESKSQSKWMRYLVGQAQGVLRALQCLIRITQTPEIPGGKAQAKHPRIN